MIKKYYFCSRKSWSGTALKTLGYKKTGTTNLVQLLSR
jgi:hypothetical protein